MKRYALNLNIILIGLLIAFITPATAEEEPLIDKLRETFQKEYLSLGFVLQVVGDGQMERSFPGRNGFNIANMRVVISGKLDKNFGYLLRANFINAVSVLDANMHYRFSRAATVDIGLFKSPFSKEFLTPAESIDFVNRSQVVTVLAPGRQIGLQVRGTIVEQSGLDYSAGIFNGNGFGGNTNDNDNFMYAGRLSLSPFRNAANSQSNLEIGLNSAFSKDRFARVGEQLNPFVFEPLYFSGERTLWGGDIRFAAGGLLLAGEYISGDFEGTFSMLASGAQLGAARPSGYHLTAGYMLTPGVQVLGRFDSFEGDDERVNRDLVILGLNYWPTQATEFQLNYIIDTDDNEFKHHQLLINAQIAF